jgi:hypothetical protein
MWAAPSSKRIRTQREANRGCVLTLTALQTDP